MMTSDEGGDRKPLAGGNAGEIPPDLIKPLQALIGQFSSSLNIMSMYPPGHPAVGQVGEILASKLGEFTGRISPLVLAVSPSGILWEGKSAIPLPGIALRFVEQLNRAGIAIISFDGSVGPETLERFLSFLTGCRERLTPAALPADSDLPGIRVSLVDYAVFAADTVGEGGLSPEERELSMWTGMVSAFLKGESLLAADGNGAGLAALLDDPGRFARTIAGALGPDPPEESLRRLAGLFDEARAAVVAAGTLSDEECLAKMKEGIVALPEELRARFLSAVAGENLEAGRTVREACRLMSVEEMASILVSSVAVEGKSLKRVKGLLELLVSGEERRRDIMPDLQQQMEKLAAMQMMGAEEWQRIRNFLSPSADKYVSVPYERVLEDALSRAPTGEEDISAANSLRQTFLASLAEEEMRGKYLSMLIELLFMFPEAGQANPLEGEIRDILGGLMDSGVEPASALDELLFLREGLGSAADRAVREILEGVLTESRLEALFRRLAAENGGTWERCAELVALVPREAARAFLAVVVEGRGEAILEPALPFLKVLGASLAREAVKLLDDGRPEVVCRILGLLGAMGDTSAVTRITALAASRHAAIRKAAYGALFAVGAAKGRGLLRQALDDDDPEIISQAARFISGVPELREEFTRALLATIREFNVFAWKDRKIGKAVRAVAEIRPPEAVPVLSRLVARRAWLRLDPKWELPAAAASALAAYRTPEARAILERRAGKGDDPVARHCRAILKSMR